MRWLLVVLAVFLVPDAASALRYDGAKVLPWKGDRVVVRDHLPEAWRPLVRDLVDDFNAATPSGGPELAYEAAEEIPCGDLADEPPHGVIRLCERDDLSGSGHAYSWLNKKETAIVSGSIDISRQAINDQSWARYALCHEMMHAFTHVRDRYDARPDTSCVWGSLNEPGSWDIALLERIYGQARKH
jgi:hypothetical protein